MKAREKATPATAETTAAPRRRSEETSDVGLLAQAMGQRLGADVSGVRFHTGARSARAAEELGARAFTVGQDIHFAAGELDPGSREGKKLIAHELVHAIQGTGRAPATKLKVAAPGDAAEREADALADTLVDGRGPVAVRERPEAALHRKAQPGEDKPETTVTPLGVSGLPQTQTPTGKLIYPLTPPDAGGASVKGLNRATANLIDAQQALDRHFLWTSHESEPSGEEGGFFAEHAAIEAQVDRADADIGKEIEANLDGDVADEATRINDVALDVGLLRLLTTQAVESLEDARSSLRSAHRRYNAAQDRKKVARLDGELAVLDRRVDLVKDGITAIEKAILDPQHAAEQAIDFGLEKWNDFWAEEYKDMQAEERDEAAADALDEELEAAEEDEERARRQVRNAGNNLREVQSQMEDTRSHQDKRARRAEKKYDAHSSGPFKFGDLRRHADRAGRVAALAEEGRGIVAYFLRPLHDVREQLEQLVAGGDLARGPEVVEENATLGSMLSRVLRQDSYFEDKASQFRHSQARLEAKLAHLDYLMAQAAERREPDAEEE